MLDTRNLCCIPILRHDYMREKFKLNDAIFGNRRNESPSPVEVRSPEVRKSEVQIRKSEIGYYGKKKSGVLVNTPEFRNFSAARVS